MKARAFKSDESELWGVEQGCAIVYEPEFSKEAATRIAQLESSKHPPADWCATEKILRSEGIAL